MLISWLVVKLDRGRSDCTSFFHFHIDGVLII